MLITKLTRPRSGTELLTGFKQGDAGNCASIATIKAALAASGDESVLSNVEASSEIVRFSMRDDPAHMFEIGLPEAQNIAASARFEGADDELLNHARFLFVAMVVRAIRERPQKPDLESMVQDLNDGEYYWDTPDLLGLEEWKTHGPGLLLAKKRKRFLEENVAGIAASRKHAWFVSNGVHDRWGNPDDSHVASRTMALVRP